MSIVITNWGKYDIYFWWCLFCQVLVPVNAAPRDHEYHAREAREKFNRGIYHAFKSGALLAQVPYHAVRSGLGSSYNALTNVMDTVNRGVFNFAGRISTTANAAGTGLTHGLIGQPSFV